MGAIGQPERETQKRMLALFRDEIHYDYLGDFSNRPNNSNIEEGLLTTFPMPPPLVTCPQSCPLY